MSIRECAYRHELPAREGWSENLCLSQPGVGRVAFRTEPGVEGESDDVSMRYAGVGAVAADPTLELEDFGDGVVELSAFGVAVSDDVQSVRMRRKNVIARLGLGFERVGDLM
ncbi:hypothetical protein [Streptomyces sp. NPDC002588]|uniref:hypothetical protein n=1 Tax=Streptomyces sp. NPDC002588 TaxID=3154419 RepID=UPI003326B90A